MGQSIRPIVVAVLTIALAANSAKADALTMRDYAPAAEKFFERYLIDAYTKHGEHDPNWDETVRKLLVAYTTLRANDWIPQARFGSRAAVDEADFRALVETVKKSACDDPLARALVTVLIFHKPNQFGYAPPERVAALNALRESGYPEETKLIIYMIASDNTRHINTGTDSDFANAFYQDGVVESVPAMLAKGRYSGIERRLAGRLLVEALDGVSVERRLEAFDETKPETQDAWLREYLLAIANTTLARRNSRYSPGTPESYIKSKREAYARHQAEAARAYEAAYTHEPTFPEAPARLILLAADGFSKTPARTWFERAIAAQFDHAVSYANYERVVSTDEQVRQGADVAFAIECMKTRRYETDVPWTGVEMFERFSQSRGLEKMLADQPLRDEVIATLTAYTTKFESADNRLTAASAVIALHWRLGQFDEALAAWTQAGRAATLTEATSLAGMSTSRLEDGLAALGGAAGASLRAAEALAFRKDFKAAHAAYAAAAEPSDPKAKRFVATRRRELEFAFAYAHGEWVSLKPDALTWRGQGDPGCGFTVEPDGTLVLTRTKGVTASVVFFPEALGTRYALEADLELVAAEPDKRPTLAGGFYTQSAVDKRFSFAALQVRDDKLQGVRFKQSADGDDSAEMVAAPKGMDVPKQVGFLVDGEDVLIYFPGTRVESIESERKQRRLADASVGFFVGPASTGSTLRVTNIRVRKLLDQ